MKRFVFILFILVFAISCGKDEEDFIVEEVKSVPGDSATVQTDTTVVDSIITGPLRIDLYAQYKASDSLDSTFYFFPEEVYGELYEVGIPELELRLITDEIYLCENYEIAYTTFLKNDELIIRLDSINKPFGCVRAIGPAKASVPLAENVKQITFINGQSVDQYSVTIDSVAVSLLEVKQFFSHALHAKTFRYPKNSFAFICGTYLTNTHLRQSFIDILADSTSVTPFVFEGEGRVPYQESTQGNYVNFPSLYYKYDKLSDFELAGKLLEDFSRDSIVPNSGVSMTLTNWENRRYRSKR